MDDGEARGRPAEPVTATGSASEIRRLSLSLSERRCVRAPPCCHIITCATANNAGQNSRTADGVTASGGRAAAANTQRELAWIFLPLGYMLRCVDGRGWKNGLRGAGADAVEVDADDGNGDVS